MIELHHDVETSFDNERRKWPWSKPTETRTIFDGLSARIEEGHAVALRGINGCGKTTLLRLIYGALLPSRGEVRVSVRRRQHGVTHIQPSSPRHAIGYFSGGSPFDKTWSSFWLYGQA